MQLQNTNNGATCLQHTSGGQEWSGVGLKVLMDYLVRVPCL